MSRRSPGGRIVRHSRAVYPHTPPGNHKGSSLETLRDAVSAGEFDGVLAQLSEEYHELLGPVASR
ncbi:hypothetical protein ABT297_11395 [Dactylosporangium sp. NPDC000555]|uniref:hypothetical protein n=1 Tax=Dactylosporangium sp. NPDC000555 TaxID=3154260 RepID=UPI0033238672